MCEACRFESNGDVPYDRKRDLYKKMVGALGGKPIYIWFMIADLEEPCIDFDISHDGNMLFQDNIPINYCPVCGRKLKEE